MKKLYKISEVSEILKLINPKTNKPSNHILRFWEKEFNQIRPKKINNRRYYTTKQLELLKMIKFLLKNSGMTISGVKRVLKSNINELDDSKSHGLKADYYKKFFKERSKKLLNKIIKIKSYGKKNSS
tara:strand:+ start:664 stop:1044 length:381 start_codon:yes stop_codon:yes gene_type:complete